MHSEREIRKHSEHDTPQAHVHRSDEHPAHQRQQYRRAEDRERESYIANIKNEPLTINKIAILMGIFFAMNQSLAWWRSNNVTPEALRQTNTRVERLAEVVDSLTRVMKTKKDGDNFFYYSICYSWRSKFPTQYPAFCDSPEIQQFDPLGRAIPNPK